MIFEKICAGLITLIAGAVIVALSMGVISADLVGISALVIAAISFLLLILIHLKEMIRKEDDVKAMNKMVSDNETKRLDISHDIEWHG